MTLTKEWLLKTIAELEEERDAVPGVVNEDAAKALAAMKLALASLEAEPGVNHQPVAWQYKEYVHVRGLGYLWREKLDCEFPGADCETLQDVVPLYIAPPAPVSLPDELPPHEDESYGTEDDCYKAGRVEGWNACRAAMLQGAEPVTTAYKLPANVIDALEKALEAMSFMGDTLNAMDAVCEEDVEYVTPAFEAVRSALNGNSPVIPDGWVACSERMPDINTEIFYFCKDDGLRDCGIVSSSNFIGRGDAQLYVHAEGYDLRLGVDITHWMPLPAAPQQEVK